MSWKLLIIEAVGAPGKGNLILTGQPGHVIKESAQVALSLVRTRAKGLGTPLDGGTERLATGERWGYRLGGAALMFPSAEPRSRLRARSPIETIPTGRLFSTTGSRRIALSRINRTASSMLS